jgi:hypothetical protein
VCGRSADADSGGSRSFLNGESLGNGDNSLQNIGLETFFLPPGG